MALNRVQNNLGISDGNREIFNWVTHKKHEKY